MAAAAPAPAFSAATIGERVRSRGYLNLYPQLDDFFAGGDPCVSSLKAASGAWRDSRRKRRRGQEEEGDSTNQKDVHAASAHVNEEAPSSPCPKTRHWARNVLHSRPKSAPGAPSRRKELAGGSLRLPLRWGPVATIHSKIARPITAGSLQVETVHRIGVHLGHDGQARLKHERVLAIDEIWPLDLPPTNPLKLNLQGWIHSQHYPLIPMLERRRREGDEDWNTREGFRFADPPLADRSKRPQDVVEERMRMGEPELPLPTRRWSGCKFWGQGVASTWSQVWSRRDGCMLSRVALWRGVRLISHSNCVVTVWGVGIAGRVVVAGTGAWPRHIEIEVYCTQNSFYYRLELHREDLHQLFVEEDAGDLLPGRRSALLSVLVKMLRFEYAVGVFAPQGDSDECALHRHNYVGSEPWACLEGRASSGRRRMIFLSPDAALSLPENIPQEGKERMVLVRQRLVMCRDQGKIGYDEAPARFTEFGLRIQERAALKLRREMESAERLRAYMSIPSRLRGRVCGCGVRTGGILLIGMGYIFADQSSSISVTLYEPCSSSEYKVRVGLTTLGNALGGAFAQSVEWTPEQLAVGGHNLLTRRCELVSLGSEEEGGPWVARAVGFTSQAGSAPTLRKSFDGSLPPRKRAWQLQQGQLTNFSGSMTDHPRRDCGKGCRLTRGAATAQNVRGFFSLWRDWDDASSFLLEMYVPSGFHVPNLGGCRGATTFSLRLRRFDVLAPGQPEPSTPSEWRNTASKLLRRCFWNPPSSPANPLTLVRSILSHSTAEDPQFCLALDTCIYKRMLKISGAPQKRHATTRRLLVAVSQVGDDLFIRAHDPLGLGYAGPATSEVEREAGSQSEDLGLIQQLQEMESDEERNSVIELLLSSLVLLQGEEGGYTRVALSTQQEEDILDTSHDYVDLVKAKTGEARDKASRRAVVANSPEAKAAASEKARKKKERAARLAQLRKGGGRPQQQLPAVGSGGSEQDDTGSDSDSELDPIDL
jgi:hypothetical protein